jgi:hypothetical protein
MYPRGPVVDPRGPQRGEGRVLRGGGWIDYGRNVRSACRLAGYPGFRSDGIGFRLARGQVSSEQQGKQSRRRWTDEVEPVRRRRLWSGQAQTCARHG